MCHEPQPKRRSPGRPLSQVARRRALVAAHDILVEEGFGRLTIEAVAVRSGVGKPTIYRNWSNASELAMAALMLGLPDEDDVDTADLERGLRQQVVTLVRTFASTRGRQITMALAAADPESEFTKAFRNRVILSSRQAGNQLIEKAITQGVIVRPVNLGIVLDMIYGPLFFRLLVGHGPVNEQFGHALVESTLCLLGLKPPK